MVIKKICVIGVTKVYVNTVSTVSKWNVFRRRCCCEKSVSDFSHCSESAMQRFIQCKFNCRLATWLLSLTGKWTQRRPFFNASILPFFSLCCIICSFIGHLFNSVSTLSLRLGGGHMSLSNHAEPCHLKPTGGLRCVPVMVQRCLHSYGSQTATVLWFEKSRAFRSSCSVSWVLTEFLKSNQG